MSGLSPRITKITDIVEDLFVTPAKLGEWLNLSSSAITAKIDLLTELIQTATELIEEYAWLSLRRTTYIAEFYLPSYNFQSSYSGNLKLSLERSPIIDLDDITKIEYLNSSGTYTEYDRGTQSAEGIYENSTEKKEQNKWASVYLKNDVPYDDLINAYKIRITFISGYVTTETEASKKIPNSLLVAIKLIASYFYTNRGDCEGSSSCSMNGTAVPCGAKTIVDKYSISKGIVGGAYNTNIDNCY